MSMKQVTKALFSGGGIGDKAVTKTFIDDPIEAVPEAAPAPDPTSTPEYGGDPLDSMRRRRKTSGRASTIQAGSLIPTDIGKKSLLG